MEFERVLEDAGLDEVGMEVLSVTVLEPYASVLEVP